MVYVWKLALVYILTKQFADARLLVKQLYPSKLEPKGLQCSRDLHLDPDNRTQPRLIILLPRGIPSYSQRTEEEPISAVSDDRTICKRRRIDVEEIMVNTSDWILILEHQKKIPVNLLQGVEVGEGLRHVDEGYNQAILWGQTP